MAGEKIKGITIELNGNSTNLTKNIKDSNTAVNNFGRELKDVNRLLKLDPSNLTLVQQKNELLGKSIATTKEKLKEMEAAQKQVKAQYANGTIDGGQYRNFQRELEKTKTSLQELEKEKKTATSLAAGFESLKEKVQGVQEKLAPVAKGLQVIGDVTVTAVDIGKKALTAYATAVVGVASAIGALTLKNMQYAGDLDDAANRTGMAAESLQEYQYAAKLSGMEAETLEKAMIKQQKAFSDAKDGSKGMAEAYKRLGINLDEVGNSSDAFDAVIASLADMEDETTRNALANDIFGKSYAELSPMLAQGSEGIAALKQEARDLGGVMGGDSVAAMAELDDNIDRLKTSAGGAGRAITANFAPAIAGIASTITDNMPGISDAIGQLFSGGDPAAAQAALTQNFTQIVTAAVDGIAEQLPTFLTAFNAVVLSVVSAVSAGLPTIVKTILPTLISGLVGLVQGLVKQIPTVIPLLLEGALTLFTGLLDGINQTIPLIIEMLPGLIDDIVAALVENLPVIIEGAVQLFVGLAQGIAQSVPSLVDAVVALIPVIVQSLMDNLPALIKAGLELIIALAGGIIQAIPDLVGMLPQVISSIVDGLLDGLGAIGEVGLNLVQGLWEGIKNAAGWLMGKLKEWAGSIIDGLKGFLGIHSPSSVMADEIGHWMGEGVGVGFIRSMRKVRNDMARAIPTNFKNAIEFPDPRKPNSPAAVGGGATGGTVFNQTNNYHSPKALSAAEAARKTRNDTKALILQAKVVPA